MEKTYELHLAGVTRILPIRRLSPHISVPSFVMMGDTQLIEACASALVAKLPAGIEYLVCPEAKAIALTHAMARLLNVNYVVVRKSVKAYMDHPISVEVTSITTTGKQILVIDGTDVAKLAGKKVCIVDDVVSTGGSVKGLKALLEKTSCRVIAMAAPLWEDGGFDGKGLTYIQIHPVFRD